MRGKTVKLLRAMLDSSKKSDKRLWKSLSEPEKVKAKAKFMYWKEKGLIYPLDALVGG